MCICLIFNRQRTVKCVSFSRVLNVETGDDAITVSLIYKLLNGKNGERLQTVILLQCLQYLRMSQTADYPRSRPVNTRSLQVLL